MIKNMSDFPFPCKNIFCKQEEKFKSMAERLFGVKVKQTLFMKGAKTQYHLYVWYEPTIDDQFFDESIWENNYFNQQKMIMSYFDCYNIPGYCYQETYLHLLNYRKALTSYSYGHAAASVKKAIQNKYTKTVVSLDYAANIFIIESDCPLTDREDEITHICYKLLKEYDDYNIITLRDVNIKIIKGGRDSNLNDIHMMNRKI